MSTNFLRRDEWLASLTLPELAIHDFFLFDTADVLITCAGFEDRALEFLRRAIAAGARGFTVIAVGYLPSLAANRSQELESLAGKGEIDLKWLPYNREDPSDPGPEIFAAMPFRRLHIDISGMSRLLIVQLLTAIVRSGNCENTSVIYCEAMEYPPTQQEFDSSIEAKSLRNSNPTELDELVPEPDSHPLLRMVNFVSSGVFGIIVPRELSTVSMYGQPIRLISFPTFNPAQFAALCAEINSAYITIIHGKSPHLEDEWKRDAIRRLNGIEMLQGAREEETSTLDYRETLKLMIRIYQQHGDREKLIVAPTGSKMQSLAVGIAVGVLPDIQIVYPTPRSFPSPENYTTGVRNIYHLSLGFLKDG